MHRSLPQRWSVLQGLFPTYPIRKTVVRSGYKKYDPTLSKVSDAPSTADFDVPEVELFASKAVLGEASIRGVRSTVVPRRIRKFQANVPPVSVFENSIDPVIFDRFAADLGTA